jgi:hypothetical protein
MWTRRDLNTRSLLHHPMVVNVRSNLEDEAVSATLQALVA